MGHCFSPAPPSCGACGDECGGRAPAGSRGAPQVSWGCGGDNGGSTVHGTKAPERPVRGHVCTLSTDSSSHVGRNDPPCHGEGCGAERCRDADSRTEICGLHC